MKVWLLPYLSFVNVLLGALPFAIIVYVWLWRKKLHMVCGGKIAYGCGGKIYGGMVVADVL